MTTDDPTAGLSELDAATILDIAGSCGCAALRKATRAVTQAYDAALEPEGIKVTQLTLLVAVAVAGRVSMSRLAAALVMDRTTLSRNLRPLEAKGWLRIVPGADRRARLIELTPDGARMVTRAAPRWRLAQERMKQRLGPIAWASLKENLNAATAAARPPD